VLLRNSELGLHKDSVSLLIPSIRGSLRYVVHVSSRQSTTRRRLTRNSTGLRLDRRYFGRGRARSDHNVDFEPADYCRSIAGRYRDNVLSPDSGVCLNVRVPFRGIVVCQMLTSVASESSPTAFGCEAAPTKLKIMVMSPDLLSVVSFGQTLLVAIAAEPPGYVFGIAEGKTDSVGCQDRNIQPGVRNTE
jgi:hypothetical protein